MENQNIPAYELNEFLVMPNTSALQSESTTARAPEFRWSHQATKILIEVYGTFKRKLGSFDVKNSKMMWWKISQALLDYNIKVTPNNCMNRWRVLERNYKKYVDNQRQTGRGRTFFEYKHEMEEVFLKKKNIHPELLLASDQIDTQIDMNSDNAITTAAPDVSSPSKSVSSPKSLQAVTPQKKSQIIRKRQGIMEKIRSDCKTYYEEKLHIENLKLEEMKKRNQLIEERNNILKEKQCNCHQTSS
ncbi:unnamed protein product [Acanthoscelides obtectus]|uniref:Myb/SANT-like DNA-binding domain-containing protein n=1 Tax=Acanthoscelides obtectus TaxID=200917 RepID=A0A9P0LMW1_ACAOB|nr:unnamed protein product [Acanthoscelides obtectus]CAK1624107.1 hypothetical protein AOBTE_LOCUS2329 [Acanthoscelides obtectus]